MLKRIFLGLTLISLISGTSMPPVLAQSSSGVRFERSSLAIQTASKSHKFSIEIASTERQQQHGLMFRRRMAADAGMLFIYPVPQVITMWMKNTYIPLDMLFIGPDGTIVSIVQRAIPGSLETISSTEPAIAVLEVNGGTVSRLKIKRGDRINYPAFQGTR